MSADLYDGTPLGRLPRPSSTIALLWPRTFDEIRQKTEMPALHKGLPS